MYCNKVPARISYEITFSKYIFNQYSLNIVIYANMSDLINRANLIMIY